VPLTPITNLPPSTPDEGDEVAILDQWGNVLHTVTAAGLVIDPHSGMAGGPTRVIGWHDESGEQYWFGYDFWEVV